MLTSPFQQQLLQPFQTRPPPRTPTVEPAAASAQEHTNLDALPPPIIDPRPGPSDWMNVNGPVCDGDYITFRNNAWSGVVISHGWNPSTNRVNGTEVRGIKNPNQKPSNKPKELNVSRMDNRYTFCVRRMEFDSDKKAWVLPHWTAWKDRLPIKVTDHVCFLVPNDPSLALGTDNPPGFGNNGDYRVKLVDFPLATKDTLINHTVTGHLQKIVSLGFWRDDKNNVDFLNQSRCVWTFHNFGANQSQSIVMSGSPLNIRNMWTEIRAKETQIWEFIGNGPASIGTLINKTFHGGRNLTQAAGSGGSTIKLALHNKDTDDKAGWIIDAWHGNRYPVQRALVPVEPPPLNPDLPPEQQPEVPDLTEQIQNPVQVPGMTYDPTTGTNIHTGLEEALQGQNPDDFWDIIAKFFYGKKWNHLTYTEQFSILALIGLGGYVGVNKALDRVL